MKIENRQRTLAIAAITVVVLLASDRLIFAPLTRSWKARAERIAELKREVSQGGMLLERERVIRTRWSAMRTNTLPNNVSAAESEVFKAFDRWEQDSKISVTSKKPQWKRNEDDYMTFECRVDASGTLSALTRFLYEVEKDPLALKVESVEITSRDNNGQQLSLALQVSGLMLNPPTQP
jgi:hypothetical protein